MISLGRVILISIGGHGYFMLSFKVVGYIDDFWWFFELRQFNRQQFGRFDFDFDFWLALVESLIVLFIAEAVAFMAVFFFW